MSSGIAEFKVFMKPACAGLRRWYEVWIRSSGGRAVWDGDIWEVQMVF